MAAVILTPNQKAGFADSALKELRTKEKLRHQAPEYQRIGWI
jgi:hypothetical protein